MNILKKMQESLQTLRGLIPATYSPQHATKCTENRILFHIGNRRKSSTVLLRVLQEERQSVDTPECGSLSEFRNQFDSVLRSQRELSQPERFSEFQSKLKFKRMKCFAPVIFFISVETHLFLNVSFHKILNVSFQRNSSAQFQVIMCDILVCGDIFIESHRQSLQ